jgi:hypothetical protein
MALTTSTTLSCISSKTKDNNICEGQAMTWAQGAAPRSEQGIDHEEAEGHVWDMTMDNINVKDPTMWFAILDSQCKVEQVL